MPRRMSRVAFWVWLLLAPGASALAGDGFVAELQAFHDIGTFLASQGKLKKSVLLPKGVELEDRQLIVPERGKEGQQKTDPHVKPATMQALAKRGSLRDLTVEDPCRFSLGYSTFASGFFPDSPGVTGLVPPLHFQAAYMPSAGKACVLTVFFDPKKGAMNIQKISTELRQRPVRARPVRARSVRKTAGERPAIAGGYVAYLRLFHDIATFLKEQGEFKHAKLLHSHASFRHTGPSQRLMPGTIQELAEREGLRHADLSRPVKLNYSRRCSPSSLKRVMTPGVVSQSNQANVLFMKVHARYLATSGQTCELTVEFFQRGDEVTIQNISTHMGDREKYRVAPSSANSK